MLLGARSWFGKCSLQKTAVLRASMCAWICLCMCEERGKGTFAHRAVRRVCLSFPGSQRVLRRKNALFSWAPLNYSITNMFLFLHFRSLLGFQSEIYFNPNQNVLALRALILSYIYIKIKEHSREKGSEPHQAVCVQFFSLLEMGFLLCCPGCSQTHECKWSSCLKFQSSWDFMCLPPVCLYLVFCIGSIKVRPPEGSFPRTTSSLFQGMHILC